MAIPHPGFAEGDSVAVRQNVDHPDLEYNLDGWQGRVTEQVLHDTFGWLLDVEWDSVTLEQMPVEYIEECDLLGIDWTHTLLLPEALLPAVPRDTVADVTRVAAELSDRYESAGYSVSEDPEYIRAQQERIARIVAQTEGEPEALARWADVLGKNLSFPFKAYVWSFQEQGPLQEGDEVQVKRLSLVNDEYGVLVAVEYQGSSYDFPLYDLDVVDEHSPNYQLVDDYATWADETDIPL